MMGWTDRKILVPGAALWLAACGSGASPLGTASGSSAMVRSADGSALFIADADNGEVARISLQGGAIEALVAGLEPTRIARIGDRLFVTLRAQRSLAVLKDTAEGLVIEQIVEVGPEPYGVVASPDGRRVYVALSMGDAVVELDAVSLARGRAFPVPHEPRWLAITPDGENLYVATAMRGKVYGIDLDDGAVIEVRLPGFGRGVFVPAEGDTGGRASTEVDLSPRVTGDIAIDPSGTTLAIPALYVDNFTSAGSMDPLGSEGGGGLGEKPVEGGGYAGTGETSGLSRFNPAVVVVPLDPRGRAREEEAQAMLVAGFGAVDGDVDPPVDVSFSDPGAVPLEGAGSAGREPTFLNVRGYLTSVTFSPDGHMIAATVEGGRSVAFVAAEPVATGRPSSPAIEEDAFFGDGAFAPTPRVFVGTGEGPRAVLWGEDAILALSYFDRAVGVIEPADVARSIEASAMQGIEGLTWTVGHAFELAPSILPPEVLEGRRLFFSATTPQMATAGAGVSCATCHNEGRTDGLTWTFDGGVRQTPSLAGPVGRTAPVSWTNGVESVAREAQITSQGRMGGAGIAPHELDAIAAFVDHTRDVDVPGRGSQDAAVLRGKALFERGDVGCASCHSGERLTDNRSYRMFGLEAVNTPGLVGIAATGPYLHDGSAETLRDVIDRADEGGMGATRHLSEAEKDDLEAYLRTL